MHILLYSGQQGCSWITRISLQRKIILHAGPGVGAGLNVEQLRTVVASLATAVAFSRALAGAMPTLTQLLASSSLTDVQVVIQ